jgi:anti-sigma B factor antagonist
MIGKKYQAVEPTATPVAQCGEDGSRRFPEFFRLADCGARHAYREASVFSTPAANLPLATTNQTQTTHNPLLRLMVDIAAPATTLVTVAGEVDAATAPQLSDALRPHLTAHGNVLVDLSAVTFLSAAGLHVLVDAHWSMQAGGGTLKLITGPRCVDRVLTLTGLDTVLDFYQPGSSVRRLDTARSRRP